MTFTSRELSLVGLASSMMIAGGFAIVILQSALGGYNSLAQALPKGVLDGAVLALLMGQTRRWRLIVLLGGVVGTFLGLVAPAVPYLLLVIGLAGTASAICGWMASAVSRPCPARPTTAPAVGGGKP